MLLKKMAGLPADMMPQPLAVAKAPVPEPGMPEISAIERFRNSVMGVAAPPSGGNTMTASMMPRSLDPFMQPQPLPAGPRPGGGTPSLGMGEMRQALKDRHRIVQPGPGRAGGGLPADMMPQPLDPAHGAKRDLALQVGQRARQHQQHRAGLAAYQQKRDLAVQVGQRAQQWNAARRAQEKAVTNAQVRTAQSVGPLSMPSPSMPSPSIAPVNKVASSGMSISQAQMMIGGGAAAFGAAAIAGGMASGGYSNRHNSSMHRMSNTSSRRSHIGRGGMLGGGGFGGSYSHSRGFNSNRGNGFGR